MNRFLLCLETLLVLFAPAVRLPAQGADGPPAISAEEIREHVKFLASDALAGRGAGTEGDRGAENYIAGLFREWGLAAAGPEGSYLQPFDFPVGKRSKLGEGNRLEKTGPEATSYVLDRDWTPLFRARRKDATGSLLFAGYGVVWKEQGYDDYSGVDARGKVVLVLRHTPGEARTDTPWKQKAMVFGPFTYKAERAAEKGAAALIVVNDPNNHPVNGGGLYRLRRSARNERTSIPCLFVTREVADGWVRTAGTDLSTLQTKIDHDLAPAPLEVPAVNLSLATVVLEEDGGKSRTANVVGVVEGNDPVLRNERVVLGAHHDHLGPEGFDPFLGDVEAIHNGADDNASGVAGLLAIARAVALAGERPKRSIVFVTFGAEELGLLGSRHFLQQPPFPIDKAVAMINLDMIGRARDGQVDALGLRTSPGFVDDVQRWNGDLALKLRPRGGFQDDSDHASFAEKKIPVIFFTTGLHEDYHLPSDDWEKLNYPAAALVAELARRGVLDLAGRPERPAFQRATRRRQDF